jgi:hypothetical protein
MKGRRVNVVHASFTHYIVELHARTKKIVVERRMTMPAKDRSARVEPPLPLLPLYRVVYKPFDGVDHYTFMQGPCADSNGIYYTICVYISIVARYMFRACGPRESVCSVTLE